jgi:hypothetical protein
MVLHHGDITIAGLCLHPPCCFSLDSTFWYFLFQCKIAGPVEVE